MASLGWVTPGAASELGCHPSIFYEKPGDLCCSSLSLSLSIIAYYSFHSGVTPLEGVTPHLFLPVRPRFSTILCKFAHKIFFLRVSPPGGCHPERSAPSAPSSDATAYSVIYPPILITLEFTVVRLSAAE